LAIKRAEQIKAFIAKQISNYNYTFPTARGVSDTVPIDRASVVLHLMLSNLIFGLGLDKGASDSFSAISE
jgi:uncharacterized membrane protein